MKTIQVTELEKQVLDYIASEMYAELGYSDIGPTEVEDGTGIEMSVLRGVLGSLVKKDLIDIDRRETKNIQMWIIYLTDNTQGLVKHWVAEDNIEKVELKTK